MYVMVYTRPDLSYVVSVKSHYTHNPSKDHWEVVKCILCYVKGTINKRLALDEDRLQLIMLQSSLILIMVVSLIKGDLFLVSITSVCCHSFNYRSCVRCFY